MNSEEQVVKTVCNSHCVGTCALKAHVKDGKIIRIEADADEAGQQHRACAKGRAYRQRVYAPDRLLYPLKRTGARGSGKFARISWDEALDTVAEELRRVKEVHGNASILHFCSMCDPFTLHHVNAFHRLLCQFGGYTAPWGTISNEGLMFANAVTYGTRWKGPEPGELQRSRLIIMWAWNPATTHQGTHVNLSLLRAKENGTKIINVDARFSDSAAVFADQWIPIRPCTDTAVLVAMAYVIVTEGLQDQSFIDKYTFGFDQFRDYLLGLEDGTKKTPEWAAAISGVPADTIATLAREYARAKPAMIATGYSAGRTAYGEQFHRAVFTLEAITGNTDVSSETGREQALIWNATKAHRDPILPNPVEMGKPVRWNALPSRGDSVNSTARVNVNLFAEAILQGKAGGFPADYKFLWFSNTNYLNQLGDINKAAKALQEPDFVLVTEQFMTATARYADIVLPVCTYFERNDLCMPGQAPGFPDHFALVPKAIEPLGESRSQLQICEALALKLGINDYNDRTDEELVRSKVEKLSQALVLPDYDSFREQTPYKPNVDQTVVPTKNNADLSERKLFPTPSGKIEIFSQVIAKMDHPLLPPIPKYIEAWESINDPLAKKYPLQLITPHAKLRVHSQFDNLPWLRALRNQGVTISSKDAETRGLRDGDLVRVFNDRGEMIIPCRVTERIMPGVVAIRQGAWYAPDQNNVDRGGCPNVLTKNATSPAGAFTSSTALVQIEKVAN